MAREVQHDVHYSKVQWLDPQLLHSACPNILVQDIKPQIP